EGITRTRDSMREVGRPIPRATHLPIPLVRNGPWAVSSIRVKRQKWAGAEPALFVAFSVLGLGRSRRRSRASPGGRFTAIPIGSVTLRRLVTRTTPHGQGQGGAHGGTRGFPVLGHPPHPPVRNGPWAVSSIRVKRQKWAGAEPALFMVL